LRRSKIHAVGVDPSVLGEADLDGLGEFIDSGRTVMLGVVPSVAQGGSLSPEQLAQQAATLTDRLGFPREVLAQRVGVTPACGLAGATPEWARRAIELAQKTAETLAGDPEAI
jgi:hypothetical protein